LIALGGLLVLLSMRGGIGLIVETDGSLFARGMLDEVNVTLMNRDNHQQKILAELIAVRGNSYIQAERLGLEAIAAATLNSGNRRMLTLVMDTAGLDAGAKYKLGVMIFQNDNSTAQPVRGSLLAVSHVADVKICDPVEVINANLSLCNEIAVTDLESDRTSS
jgi:hypothetical protein